MGTCITVSLTAAKPGYRVRVLPSDPVLAGRYGDAIECRCAREVANTVRRRLELVFGDGDSVQFANILFTSVDEAVKAVEIALDLRDA